MHLIFHRMNVLTLEEIPQGRGEKVALVLAAAAAEFSANSPLNIQLAVLNRSYGPSGISFTLISSDFTTNDQWATGNYDSTMKPALRKGTYADLNVYFLSDLGGGLLGICNFPTNASPGSSTYNQNGCDVLAQSVPGGTATNYNQGGSATHEIGHWFGLFHVFQGQACSGSGDSVSDTPLQKTATSGCPCTKDSCPNSAGLGSIHNYMNYSYDVWSFYEQLEVAAFDTCHIMPIIIETHGGPLKMNMETMSDSVRKVGDTVNSMEATVNMIDSGIDVLEGSVETIQHQLDEHFDITTTNTSLQFHRLQNIIRNRLCKLGWEKIFTVTTADRSGRNIRSESFPDTVGDYWALKEQRHFFKLLSLLIAYGIDGSRWKELGDLRLIQEDMINPERMLDIRKALMLHPDKAHRALALELGLDFDRIAATFAQYENMPPRRVKEEYSVPRESIRTSASGASQRTQPSVKREIKRSPSHQDPDPQSNDSSQEAYRTRTRYQPRGSPPCQTGLNKKRKREQPARNQSL
ncbi:MAG: hypothetical protein L6R37_008129 [Teloschistes peruensis]|nr:MAG: hypothetical protein L6R37_008129 [Teloschistes peruensis]